MKHKNYQLAFLLMMSMCWGYTVSANAAEKISGQEARRMAMQKEEGRITKAEVEKYNDVIFYVYEVTKEDGKIMAVRVNSKTGEVISGLDRLSFDTELPPEAVSQKVARDNAQKHVQEMTGSSKKPLIRDFRMTEISSKIVYAITIRLDEQPYMVIVDAVTGKVISANKIE